MAKREISRKLGVSMDFVIKWTKNKDQTFGEDRRGWPKNKPRKYLNNQEEKIISVYRSLINNPQSFFCGATAITHTWKSFYPSVAVPHVRFIGRVLKKHGLTKKIHRGRNKGASRYLLYPDYTILNTIAHKSLLEIDFIGEKFIQGRTKPINFLAFSLRGERRLKYYVRIETPTQDELMKQLNHFFATFEKPYAAKMDNGFVFFGPSSKKRFLSKTTLFLLLNNVIPIFTAPRKPWNQASVEGASSVFSRKFWNRFRFTSTEEIDERLKDFNADYQKYLNYQRPKQAEENPNFSYRVYFIRKVEENPGKGRASIQIGSERIEVNPSYLNLFTLCQWNLETNSLYIYLQREREKTARQSTTNSKNEFPKFYLQTIKKIPYALNKASEKKVVDFYLSPNR